MTPDQRIPRDIEPGPARKPPSERPDNGSRGSRHAGPSYGVRKDNPHRKLRMAHHAG